MKFTLSYFFSFFLVLYSLNAFCQPAKKTWIKCYGGTKQDVAKSILQTLGGGYIVAGTSNSTDDNVTDNHGGSYDLFVVRTNDTGGIGWTKSYGGSGDEDGSCIAPTKDGGYIIAGSSSSNDGDVTGNHGKSGSTDAWVIKIDANGNKQWQKCYGGSGNEAALSIIQNKDGGYVFVGYASSTDGDLAAWHTGYGGALTQDLWIVKINDTGAIEWQKDLGGSITDIGYSILQTESGNYIVAGFTQSNDGDIVKHNGRAGLADGWLLEFSDTGKLLWQKNYGGSNEDIFYSVKQTLDKGFITTGSTWSNDSGMSGNHPDGSGRTTDDVWVVKMDSVGNISWQNCYGGSNYDEGRDICQTNDGGYAIGGWSMSTDGDVTQNFVGGFGFRIWILLLRPDGRIDWEEGFGGSSGDLATAIKQTTDGGYVAAGRTNSGDGDFANISLGGPNDYFVLKLAKPLSVEDMKNNAGDIKIYPNPSQGNFTVQYHLSTDAALEVADVAGSVITTIPLRKGTTQTTINAAAWQPGMYFYKVMQNGNMVESGKLVKK